MIVLLGLLGCLQPEEVKTEDTAAVVFSAVSVAMSESIGAVAVVTFSASGAGEGVVLFGEQDGEGALQVSASLQQDGQWRAVLVGVPADSTGWFQVGQGETLDEERHTYTTSPAPDWLETTMVGASSDGGFLALPLMGETSGAAIVTTDGRPVWWWATGLKSQGLLSRVQLSTDHSTVWFNTYTVDTYTAGNDDGRLTGVALDGSSTQQITTRPASHHDFQVLSDDTIAMVVLDDQPGGAQGQIIRGDAIVEIAPDGTETVVWSSWDAFDYEGPPGPMGWWTTLNHLQWIEVDNDYVCSLKTLGALARIDRESGALEWVLSENAAIATLTPDDGFLHQHGFDVTEDGVLLFDNDGADGHSRILRFRFDESTGRAETTWIYDGTVSTLIMGDVLELESGNMLVSWSSQARIDEISPEGEVLSQLSFPGLSLVGYLEHREAIGLQARRIP